MNKQSTKPIFIETFGMWNWSQMLLVDGLRQGGIEGRWGSGGEGRLAAACLRLWKWLLSQSGELASGCERKQGFRVTMSMTTAEPELDY